MAKIGKYEQERDARQCEINKQYWTKAGRDAAKRQQAKGGK